MKKNDQRHRTRLLEKYGGFSLYDIDVEKRYTIDDEGIRFVTKYGYALIGNPDQTDETSTDNEYFLIHDEFLTKV